MGCGCLLVVYVLEVDEWLFFWIVCMVLFYVMMVLEFVVMFGLKGYDVFDLEWCFLEGQGVLIVVWIGFLFEVVQVMIFWEFGLQVCMMIVWKSWYYCLYCFEEL